MQKNQKKQTLTLDTRLTFGKHSGSIIRDICIKDMQYLTWLYKNSTSLVFGKDLIIELNHLKKQNDKEEKIADWYLEKEKQK